MADNTPPPPPLDPDLVREFVGNAHGNLARVEELLTQEPRLLNASWDWGGGDFENGLEAAAHMGRRDIAELLLARGARLNLVTAAMLGELAVVQAIIAAQPAALHSTGAHGIPLLVHAQAGGDAAQAVVDYLNGLLG